MRVLMSQPASSSPYHNGGRIRFGPDGMLYAIVGDGHDSANCAGHWVATSAGRSCA